MKTSDSIRIDPPPGMGKGRIFRTADLGLDGPWPPPAHIKLGMKTPVGVVPLDLYRISVSGPLEASRSVVYGDRTDPRVDEATRLSPVVVI